MPHARPIIFSTPMSQALLDGTKTQTRRVIKPQPNEVFGSGVSMQFPEFFSVHAGVAKRTNHQWIRCPYGRPGDFLWVRETWSSVFRKTRHSNGCLYRTEDNGRDINPGSMKGRWRPSIFMPRWASRTTLRITEIRPELLNSISAEDALAEGIRSSKEIVPRLTEYFYIDDPDVGWYTAKSAYVALWDKINGEGSWDNNPWVWVVVFEVIKKNIDEVGNG